MFRVFSLMEDRRSSCCPFKLKQLRNPAYKEADSLLFTAVVPVVVVAVEEDSHAISVFELETDSPLWPDTLRYFQAFLSSILVCV